MRYILGLVAVASVSACASNAPDSRSPANVTPAVDPVSGAPLSAMIEGSSVTSQSIDGNQNAAVAPGISDEQDFSAVAARESIESDAQRIESYQAAYQQAEVVAVPERPEGSSVSVVEYALSTTNTVGQSIYSRSALSGDARAERNCARYTSADFAQIAFLEAGGPKRDRHGLDPDGDGFACGWNPAPFRSARGAVEDTAVVEDSGISKADLEAVGITTDDTSDLADPAPLPGETLNISGETVASE
ncbi:hypothetical protein SAMN05444851_0701 [Aliiroseovarius sediminilitoris]|uniref:Excalibur calcium-binding domain-containing protein n=1 Tax=Aliiroseovarius sediminilitoris TaxID=1173584 RepID=A0A1I0NBD9_9RHOB|nr:hypothetical protein [Aliiroseovarius sediminilitoris]SEV98615.1 hypothetical protein SAMN05444851_0701 [Aliiroseovarius sediminilitoris]